MAIYYSSLSVVTDVVRLPLHTMLAVSDIVIADHTELYTPRLALCR